VHFHCFRAWNSFALRVLEGSCEWRNCEASLKKILVPRGINYPLSPLSPLHRWRAASSTRGFLCRILEQSIRTHSWRKQTFKLHALWLRVRKAWLQADGTKNFKNLRKETLQCFADLKFANNSCGRTTLLGKLSWCVIYSLARNLNIFKNRVGNINFKGSNFRSGK